METLITIKNLEKKFGKKKVLKDLNLQINQGERVAILGSNGCGKTTLVEMIAQTSIPTSGTIELNIQGDIKKEIGIQFQQGEWPVGICANDMLKFYRSVYPKFTQSWEEELNKVFDIEEFKNRGLRKLSGGQKQRFNAMISMMNDPALVILDELTTGLDMQLQFSIISFFKKKMEEDKKTLLLVSHSPEEVELLCTRMIIINDGKVAFDRKISEALKEFKSVRNIMNKHFEGSLKYDN
ncbi:ABC transporter ATP-binding protein [Spiroplasma sabaudiense Ar-1343]|uniref:ABC transporter ATP-binding protein n=1 Tax=Spiroplasma sabaudiense Ar-1343 TaxID=1276257 RepID=W6A909_9MOLU|nr:ABC transporter ATP-binding protein [Spiroplasma sabaudiense]AHI53451.1 ABC transporter ATP-binding protein [Spiroplasma sabaudiense Ar-1343]